MSFARLIASFFGSGYAPRAPGTAGTLAALVPGALMLALAPALLPLACLLACLGGLWAIRASAVAGDPGWVVIDEAAGMWITLLGLSHASPLGLLAAFALFRLLDILKPGPVGWADRQPGAAGIMGDDVIAGALAAGILWAVGARFPGLFG
ncbi:MAG: phosphatidylglycerophosphatase A [Rhodospirillales bacterium]|nr:phosphatidylglycerophosphatase A [Rhodospirillales bacterium]MDE2576160.1 phosphatidylglycerophosphatase A [Rhodospirillales bacterium]